MWKKALLFTVSIVLAGMLGWWAAKEFTEDDITASDAEQIVTSRYKGEVTDTRENDGKYVITLQRETGIYDFTVDKENSRVEGVEQKKEQTFASSVPEEPVQEIPPPEESEKLLTEAEAEQIALAEVPGETDDIEYEQNESTPFYLVEIEHADEQEAVVQIHAITGDIMSVTWDD